MGMPPVTKMSTTPGQRAADMLAGLFGIDLRSLAAFRIGVAGIVLVDLWYRGQNASAFFTDQGVLPRVDLIKSFEWGDTFGFQHQWSLHMLSGALWLQIALLLIAALFAFWMLIGYRTRLAAIATWLLLLSLDARNPVILDSGDVLLRCMLLFSLFLPLGARWSIDQLRRPADPPLRDRITSLATVALMLQLCMMYVFSVAFKMQSVDGVQSPWTSGYSAVYYALNIDAFTTPLGNWLRQFPQFMQAMTIGTVLLELVGPIIIFSPIFTKQIRVLACIAFAAFHAGLGLTMMLGIFPAICIVCWLVFLPGEVWVVLGGLLERCCCLLPRGTVQFLLKGLTWPVYWALGGFRRGASYFVKGYLGIAALLITMGLLGLIALPFRWLLQKPEQPSFRRRWYIEAAVACVLVYVFLWNVRELDVEKLASRTLPLSLNAPARALGLDQNWSMFAPIPRTEDGWLVMKGTLHNGQVVNLWQFDQPLPFDKPALVSKTFVSQRWLKYLDNLTTDAYAMHRLYFCNWLASRWNEQQSKGDHNREVYQVEFVQQLEITPPPGEPILEHETRVLWTWYPE